MAFEMQSREDVIQRLKANLELTDNESSKIVGSFNNDMFSANSIEFANAYNELAMAIEANFALTSWGDYLTMRTAEFGVIRKEATKSKVLLKVWGNEGAEIIAGSLFSTADDIKFYTDETVYINAEGFIEVRATAEEAGLQGNVAAETITKIPYSIPEVNSVINESAAYDGYDEETDEQLLERYLLKVRTPATSGNVYHYQQWALSIEGVGQVKVLPLWAGPGTVKVVIVDSNNATANQDLINRVAEYIESVRPIGATVTVTSPEPLLINVAAKIEGTADIDKIKVNINEYFKNNGFGLAKVSMAKICKILIDSGVTDYDYDTLQINNQSEDIVLTNDQLPVCGEVTLTNG